MEKSEYGQGGAEQEFDVELGYERRDSVLPPKIERTVQEMRHEYGINPSVEAILHFHPEIFEDGDLLKQVESHFSAQIKDSDTEVTIQNTLAEQHKVINATVLELLDSGIEDLPEEELIDLISQRSGLSSQDVRNYFEERYRLFRRYGDES